MNKTLTKTMYTLLFFATSFVGLQANASLLTLNDYTLNSETNTVTKGSLQWMQWDETQGLSINHALALNTGWRLASTTDVASLFSDFFPTASWSTDENVDSSQRLDFAEDDTLFVDFVNLFGHTSQSYDSTTTTFSDHSFAVKALFGGDLDVDGYFQAASVYDAYQFTHSGEQHSIGAYANMTGDEYEVTYNNDYTGVALVRDVQTTDVPEPSSIVIILLALLCFGLCKQRLKTSC